MPAGQRGTRTQDSYAEGLRAFMQDLAYMTTMPDADLDFLKNLQEIVLSKIRQPIDMYQQMTQAASTGGGSPVPGGGMPQMGAPGASAGGPPPGLAAMLGGGGMPPGGSPVPQGPGVPGMMNGVAMPPVDELRRLLQTGS